MTDPARKDPTAEELAELREYLPILRALKRLLAAPADASEVDRANPVKVLRNREPPAEAFDAVLRRRKRRGGDGA